MATETAARRPPDGLSILPVGTRTFLVAGDSLAAAYTTPAEAVAAVAALRRECDHGLSIALHSGDAYLRGDGHYVGPALRRCERLREIANPGQTLLTSITASVVADALPAMLSLRDLGLHRLRDLSDPVRVFELIDGTADRPTPLRSLNAYPNNLPLQVTSFVGRRDELAAVHGLLTGNRLLTLTGPGGSGKTRLAAQAAAEHCDRWPDGVWWVDLGAVSDPPLIPELVASAVGALVEPVQGPLSSLTRQLQDRRLLLCLDNCEHLLEAAATVAATLLHGCPEVSVLATSREPLRLPEEVVWQVPALAEDDALSLFVERGSHVRPRFALDSSNEAAVRTMCDRLDGMPLALELAAGWLRTLTPRQIETGLDDRFALLVRAPRGRAQRQQTLAASMAWSHDLLDEPDRILFRRLAVFAGPFTIEAAKSVCAGELIGVDEVLGALARLVDKSLVVAEERDGQARYRLLETVRSYALDRLHEAGETANTRDHHLDHYLALVEGAEPELDRDKDAWRSMIEAEYGNLRAALDWGLGLDDPDRGRRLVAGLPWLWHLHGRGPEGIECLRRAIGRVPDDRSALHARLLAGVALVADVADPLDLELDVAREALALATEHGDERLRCLCLTLAAVGQFYTDFEAAWELSLEAERAADSAGDEFVIDGARALRGIILHLRDRHDEAQPLLERAVAGLLRRGDRGVAATALSFQASGAAYSGELDAARRIAEQALRTAEPLGDYHRVGTSRSVLAMVHGLAGDVDGALLLMDPVLRLIEEADNDVFVPELRRLLGTLLLWRGDPEGALRWLEPEARATDGERDTYLATLALPPLGAALHQLGRHDDAASALDRGVGAARSLGMPRPLADALEQQAHLTADREQATDLHQQALALRSEHGLRTFCVDSLDALAAIAAEGDRPDHALRLIAASDEARRNFGYPRRPPEQAACDAAVAGLRATLGEQAFGDAWTAGARLTLDDAIAYLRRGRGPRDRPHSGWASLTPAELDVVRLAVEGYTNPEIGARLFMSRGTVKAHLSHVYAKLGVANRTELAKISPSQPSAGAGSRRPS